MEENRPLLLYPDSKITTNHKEIKKWVEKHGGRPAVFDDPTTNNDMVSIRVDFPGKRDEVFMHSNVVSEVVPWDYFFELFDKYKLAFIYQKRHDETEKDLTLAYKFVKRENIKDLLS